MTNLTPDTYQVYQITPRGGFSQRYNGTDEGEARKAYKRLEAKALPRVLNKIEGGITRQIETWGLYGEA